MKRMIKHTIVAWIVLAVLVIASGVLIAYARSNPQIRIPAGNRERFVHVVALVDGTRSMNDLDFDVAKKIVVTRLVPVVGPGDKLACYGIGPVFGLANAISGMKLEEQPPQFSKERRAEVMTLLHDARGTATPGRMRGPLYALAGELASMEPRLREIRDLWSRQIASAGRPRSSGTNLRCAIGAIDEYFRSSPDSYTERILVILSDLREDPRSGPACSGAPKDGRLAGVRIVLLHPHDSSPEWDETVLGPWRSYFGDRRIDVAPFSAVLNQASLLRPNPLSGLETQATRPFVEHLAALLEVGTRMMMFGFVPSIAFASSLAVLSRRQKRQSGS